MALHFGQETRIILISHNGTRQQRMEQNAIPIRPCDGRSRNGPNFLEEICKRRSDGAEEENRGQKNRERQPRPLRKRPPRRRVEQHLAALPFGERPSTGSTLQNLAVFPEA